MTGSEPNHESEMHLAVIAELRPHPHPLAILTSAAEFSAANVGFGSGF